ncbi:domain of Kin17 curved DNA-binding protein-domain-containing protein [Microdochium trichocladiopsis]|uniref:Domain of Kin17 curved DNA-binding protein-domain-containing protein n=1 Tax=Microdochium trichocladiopsis TaxID=1682393 RepID=A0A9P8YC78_9PEZI|nr:domain of Kin17 curved DNA-binding protein-domain-containing protein [Microdochium trichocladiopsis]KAH7033428.1 domain of Kin17 curved DNA-binding protein-domain-containing protein [Microdochium trichocladiopsis]
MPKAEIGSTKYLANKMKSKGLQRLRWYCQVCERQMRDENGFKMHTQSESHVRQMLVVGENTKKFLGEYSEQFKRDFVQLLRTSHGEKQVQINHFYQSYIANKEHVHMNATKWPNLTEFAKYLGREGVCRVEEIEGKGLHIAWIDDSPDALRRRDAIRRKEMQDKGDEEREQRMIREQIKRANREAGARGDAADKDGDEAAVEEEEEEQQQRRQRELKREEGAEKIKLSFGAKPAAKSSDSTPTTSSAQATPAPTKEAADKPKDEGKAAPATEKPAAAAPISMKITARPQTKNVFAAAKKNNALAGGTKKPSSAFEQPKKMSEAERIMKEEMERKRGRGAAGFGGGESHNKRPRM